MPSESVARVKMVALNHWATIVAFGRRSSDKVFAEASLQASFPNAKFRLNTYWIVDSSSLSSSNSNGIIDER